MIKIGILGSDNSHALAFAKLCNLPDAAGNYLYDDIRITAIYGHDDDPEHTREVADAGKIENIYTSPEDMLGTVDAVMAVHRDGTFHVPQAMPFLREKIPVWLDKPVAGSVQDAQLLCETAARYGTLITGGSTVKYNYEVETLQNKVKSGVLGTVSGGTMNFPGDFDGPYGGIFFYGSHLCEVCLAIFGYDPVSVSVKGVHPKNTVVFVRYADKLVTLHLNALCKGSFVTVYGSEKSVSAELDISFIYRLGFAKFADMLHTGRMPLSMDALTLPVYMLDAMDRSYKEDGKEVLIKK